MARTIHLTGTLAPAVTGPGKIYGYIINSHTNGTIKAWNNIVASGTKYLHNTITLPTGPQVISFPEPINFTNGLSVTVGGTLDAEIVVD